MDIKPYIKLVFFVLVFLAWYNPAIYSQSSNYNPNLDFSAIEKFWEVVDILESDKEPSAKLWDELFNTPGYKTLIQSEFRKEYFIEKFTLVFKPSERKKLEVAIKTGIDFYHLDHFVKVKERRKELSVQVSKLKARKINEDVLNRTLNYLPQKSTGELPPVAFVIFENNGRGSDPIIVDLLATIIWDYTSFLAHEYHHWFRNRQLKFDLTKVSKEETDLINALQQLEAEGIADQVDKKRWFTEPSTAYSQDARNFISLVSMSPEVIKQIDAILNSVYRNSTNLKTAGMQLRIAIPGGGHTTGYFMASLISEQLGRSELVRCVGNPFKFLILYNNAAKLGGYNYPQFSNETMQYLYALEKKFVVE
ncbi:MAG: DUF5700 domain-containing putative Zn-dependent protease [bacterium]